uniref:Uncharacterized protein n=1 Tax=Sphaerodactylus townsendi TaxID=933632 RepID=A0ACB8GD15_9SAUR
MPVPNAMRLEQAFPEQRTGTAVISLLTLSSVFIPKGEGGRVEVRGVLGRSAPGANGAHSAAGLCRGSHSGTVDLTSAQEKGPSGAEQPTDAAHGGGSARRGLPGTKLPNAPLASSPRPLPFGGCRCRAPHPWTLLCPTCPSPGLGTGEIHSAARRASAEAGGRMGSIGMRTLPASCWHSPQAAAALWRYSLGPWAGSSIREVFFTLFPCAAAILPSLGTVALGQLKASSVTQGLIPAFKSSVQG